MGELDAVNDVIESLRKVVDQTQLASLMDAVAKDMGFDWYSLIQLDMSRPHGARRLISITNYPDDWIEAITSDRRYEHDPAYLASCRTSIGFRWDEIADIVPLSGRHREVLRMSRKAGFGNGFTVPAHVPGESNGLATFVVATRRSLPSRRLPVAQLVGSFAYETARRLLIVDGDVQRTLTPRQIDCVLQVARGKSDWEISRILGISEDTVSEHVDAARSRYGVSRRGQLVVRALYDGYFSMTDAMH